MAREVAGARRKGVLSDLIKRANVRNLPRKSRKLRQAHDAAHVECLHVRVTYRLAVTFQWRTP